MQGAQRVAREKEAGILPGNMFYPVKVLAEKADMFFTFDKTEKSHKKIEIAKQKLVEAQVLLERGSLEDGQVLLEQLKTAVSEVAKDQGENQSQDDLAPVLPNSQLHEMQTALQEAELKVMEGDGSVVIPDIVETEDLAESEQSKLAEQVSSGADTEQSVSAGEKFIIEKVKVDVQSAESSSVSDVKPQSFESTLREVTPQSSESTVQVPQ